jgi:hypothetical protein
MKRCTVTVNGHSITVEARSLFYAAIAYNAEAIGGCGTRPPRLTPDSVLEIHVEGEAAPRRVVWKRVLEWSNAQAPGKR